MEQVIPYLSQESLVDLARCVKWNPVTAGEGENRRLLDSLSVEEQQSWLAQNREQLYDEIKKAGRSRWGNFWDTDSRVSYRESVCTVAAALKVPFSYWQSSPDIEAKLVEELSRRIMAEMTPEQKEQWLSRVRDEAEKHGIRIGVEAAGLGAIGLAQLSGFGIYAAAATILGAINGALGLGLGFGVFVGMSKLIALAIGPIGAAIFIVPLVSKARSADPKRLLPIVACIAAFRNSREVRLSKACDSSDVDAALALVTEMDHRGGGWTLMAICDAQPAPRRTVAFHVVRFLAGVMQGVVTTDSLQAVNATATLDEREQLARSVISQVERLAPEMMDSVLLGFHSNEFCSLRTCYLNAPEGSETELGCVISLIETIAGALTPAARSAAYE